MLLPNSLEKLASIRVCFSGEIPRSVFALQMWFPPVAVVLSCWRELSVSWSFHKVIFLNLSSYQSIPGQSSTGMFALYPAVHPLALAV